LQPTSLRSALNLFVRSSAAHSIRFRSRAVHLSLRVRGCVPTQGKRSSVRIVGSSHRTSGQSPGIQCRRDIFELGHRASGRFSGIHRGPNPLQLRYRASGERRGSTKESANLTRRCSGPASPAAELIRWVVRACIALLLSIRPLARRAGRLFDRPQETMRGRARCTFRNVVRLRGEDKLHSEHCGA
jgi:hypothetical protein